MLKKIFGKIEPFSEQEDGFFIYINRLKTKKQII